MHARVYYWHAREEAMSRGEAVSDLDRLGPARRMAEYVGHIILAASASPPGSWKQSAVRCRRRPKRRKCPGRLRVRENSSGSIEWVCPACQSQGVIHNWQGSFEDLSLVRDRAMGPSFEIVVTEPEYDQIARCLTIDPESDRIIHGATWTPEGIILRASGEDLEEFAGLLAFEANHEEDGRRRRVLDQVLIPIAT